MLIETKYFGEIAVKEEEVIHFPQGIPGFAEEKDFVLLSFEESGLFQVLQSTNAVDPAFVVVDPFLFVKDYQFKLDDTTLKQLAIKDENDLRVLVIVTVKDPLTTSTANLHAPVVINQKEKLAKQYITKNQQYTTKETIFNTSSKEEEA
ncbi:flagellar assembly factor FliW [Gracilibacillus boraciitolerans JCM 21714]|uniref:Flagellar assembly factor FliW n=1 Tax=Gracilibacillus boraciitolerans JCM 21714 TaxID=1298598 RepID=W4VNV2_9BACI|nr:flagellar assembly protein FliW [Gracilibacillus boraciitolerans]GAE95060.1 flagellar assembly factor FliW [Gracilibacillus boraciitolerans JCM 21714]